MSARESHTSTPTHAANLAATASAETAENLSSLTDVTGGRGKAFEVFSRFNRDETVWIAIADVVLWHAAQQALKQHSEQNADPHTQVGIRCWSCGCSSGEEAYYLSMIWQRAMASYFPEVDINVFGTDLCADNIAAGEIGTYPLHSVKELPGEWVQEFFDCPMEPFSRKRRGTSQSFFAGTSKSAPSDDMSWRLKDGGIRQKVSFLQQDVTEEIPTGPFDIIMSRYAVCLYLEAEQKWEVLENMVQQLRPGGYLVLGVKDCLPKGFAERFGLTSISYRARMEFLPVAIPDVIFRKDSCSEAFAQQLDPRLDAKTYTTFLGTSGLEPYWVEEPKRRLRERTEKKMSEGSRKVLALAVQQGRRAESPGLLTRMERDWDARQERAREREDTALSRNDGVVSPHPELPPEEAMAKVSQFFQRLQEDAAQRKLNLKLAKREHNRVLFSNTTSIGRLPGTVHGRRSRSLVVSAAKVSSGKSSSGKSSKSLYH